MRFAGRASIKTMKTAPTFLHLAVIAASVLSLGSLSGVAADPYAEPAHDRECKRSHRSSDRMSLAFYSSKSAHGVRRITCTLSTDKSGRAVPVLWRRYSSSRIPSKRSFHRRNEGPCPICHLRFDTPGSDGGIGTRGPPLWGNERAGTSVVYSRGLCAIAHNMRRSSDFAARGDRLTVVIRSS